MSPFPVDAIRNRFPILSCQVYGKPIVYLDNAASVQKPRVVIEAMTAMMESGYANVHRGLHYMANQATESFENARETVRGFLNAASVNEIVFTRSATEAINLVADSMGRLLEIGEGDEIVLSVAEHHSNIVPWHYWRERKGAVLKWAPVDDRGAFELDEFEKLLTERTKIVAITQMSNVLGSVFPIPDIVRLAHARGIPVLVDGSQGAVHLEIDVQALDADFYVFTGHKVYGPTGIGVLYGKTSWLERMPPWQGGGEMIREVGFDSVSYADPPHRFEAGTPPIIEAVGLGAALRFMLGIGRPAIQAHEQALLNYAQERLRHMNGIRLYGDAPEKGAILSFDLKGAHAHDVATILDRQGVAVRAGSHCAMPLLKRFGATSTCRASFALYNTFEEADKLVDALQKAESLLS